MKKCSRCKEQKPYSEYFRDRRTSDGRRSECKECSRTSLKILIDRRCLQCGAKFKARPRDVKIGWGDFCSLGCANKDRATGQTKVFIMRTGVRHLLGCSSFSRGID